LGHTDITDGSFRVMQILLHHWRSYCAKTQSTSDIGMPGSIGYPEGEASHCIDPGLPDWSKIFHVHVDASSIALGEVLVQPGEGNIDHPFTFPVTNCQF
jgi:hypothetical protein